MSHRGRNADINHHPKTAEGKQYLKEGKSLSWTAHTVKASLKTVSKWRDQMVVDGELTPEEANKTKAQYRVKKKEPAPVLARPDRISERVDQSDQGGPEWRRRRMSATIEETFHEVCGAIQMEANRLRDPKCRVKARDKAMLFQVLGEQTRKMLAMAAGLANEDDNDE